MRRVVRRLILALRIGWALALSRLLLACCTPSRAVAWSLGVWRYRDADPVDVVEVIGLAHGVSRRLPWKSTCLERALAAARVLASASVSGCVVVGVSRQDAASPGGDGRAMAAHWLDAHAWVEVPGVVSYPGPHQPLMVWRFPVSSPR
jgi:hypothetical protein